MMIAVLLCFFSGHFDLFCIGFFDELFSSRPEKCGFSLRLDQRFQDLELCLLCLKLCVLRLLQPSGSFAIIIFGVSDASTVRVFEKYKVQIPSFILPGVIILYLESLVLFVRACMTTAFGAFLILLYDSHYLLGLRFQLVLVSDLCRLIFFLCIVHILLLSAVVALLSMQLFLIPAGDD